MTSYKNKEIALGIILVILFFTYYFDLLRDGMVVSGIITLITSLYALLIWQENIYDERDEYIRSKVDRYLYIVTILMLMVDIIHKTFAHISYVSTLLALCFLSVSKIILSKLIKDKN